MSVIRYSGSLKNSAKNFIDFKLHEKLSVLNYFIVASPCKALNNPFKASSGILEHPATTNTGDCGTKLTSVILKVAGSFYSSFNISSACIFSKYSINLDIYFTY
ncbi:hypothetical protein ASQ44_04860 [Rickettsia rhipicephali]|uniref:hypothetical protein n=1 Tax=Rickettsia rhipicephali TaxID=33992 RepID=UPI00070F6645|nr:hypothetical protein [Rickettsia rhipicephali]ALN41414.1 hypothetical protein ASQ44_04860 [Rickettsia rhipicephali]